VVGNLFVVKAIDGSSYIKDGDSGVWITFDDQFDNVEAEESTSSDDSNMAKSLFRHLSGQI
jgi:hypothetical protein